MYANGFDEPVVKPEAANGKVGNRGVQAPWKNECIDAGVVLFPANGLCAELERLFPTRVEFQRFRQVEIDALRNEKEPWKMPPYKVHGADEVIQQDDVCIDVAEYGKTRSRFRLVKQVVEERGAEFVRGDVGNVVEMQFLGEFGGASVVAEENDLGLRLKLRPTLDGVALNYTDMAFKRLGNREKSEHLYKDSANRRAGGRQTTGRLVRI